MDLSPNTLEDDTGWAPQFANAKALLQINLSGTESFTIAGINNAPSLTSVYLDDLEPPAGPFPTELLGLTESQLLHILFSGLTGNIPTVVGALNKLKTGVYSILCIWHR